MVSGTKGLVGMSFTCFCCRSTLASQKGCLLCRMSTDQHDMPLEGSKEQVFVFMYACVFIYIYTYTHMYL